MHVLIINHTCFGEIRLSENQQFIGVVFRGVGILVQKNLKMGKNHQLCCRTRVVFVRNYGI